MLEGYGLDGNFLVKLVYISNVGYSDIRRGSYHTSNQKWTWSKQVHQINQHNFVFLQNIQPVLTYIISWIRNAEAWRFCRLNLSPIDFLFMSFPPPSLKKKSILQCCVMKSLLHASSSHKVESNKYMYRTKSKLSYCLNLPQAMSISWLWYSIPSGLPFSKGLSTLL